jgi:hypothetical protein
VNTPGTSTEQSYKAPFPFHAHVLYMCGHGGHGQYQACLIPSELMCASSAVYRLHGCLPVISCPGHYLIWYGLCTSIAGGIVCNLIGVSSCLVNNIIIMSLYNYYTMIVQSGVRKGVNPWKQMIVLHFRKKRKAAEKAVIISSVMT